MAQPLHMEAEFLELRTKHPFIIARGRAERLSDDLGPAPRRRGPRGLGRGDAAHASTARRRRRCWRRSTVYVAGMPTDPFDLEETERRWTSHAPDQRVRARAALSAALHDLVGKRLGIPLYRLWGLDPAEGAAVHLHHRPRHARADPAQGEGGRRSIPSSRSSWAPTATSRSCGRSASATDQEIRVDANCGWTVKQRDRHAPGAAGVRRHRTRAAAPSGSDRRAGARSRGARRFP